jgi:hypothetical protein
VEAVHRHEPRRRPKVSHALFVFDDAAGIALGPGVRLFQNDVPLATTSRRPLAPWPRARACRRGPRGRSRGFRCSRSSSNTFHHGGGRGEVSEQLPAKQCGFALYYGRKVEQPRFNGGRTDFGKGTSRYTSSCRGLSARKAKARSNLPGAAPTCSREACCIGNEKSPSLYTTSELSRMPHSPPITNVWLFKVLRWQVSIFDWLHCRVSY